MRYSDDPRVNQSVELLLCYFGKNPYTPPQQNQAPPMTRAEIIAAIRGEFGAKAAKSVQIEIH